MEIDLSLVAAALTTAIAFIMASLGAKYHLEYKGLLEKLSTVASLAKEITASIDVIVESLRDDEITKEELEVIAEHLTGLKTKLEGIQNV